MHVISATFRTWSIFVRIDMPSAAAKRKGKAFRVPSLGSDRKGTGHSPACSIGLLVPPWALFSRHI